LAYGIALAVHIVTAVAGFAPLALSGVYGSWGRRLDRRLDVEDLRRFFARRSRAGQCIWAVPVTGAVALWLRSGGGAFGEAWSIAATGCWAVAVTLAFRVIWPAEGQIGPIVERLAQAPGPEATTEDRAALQRLGRRLAWAAAVCDVAFTVAFLLMIFEPGG
jgi:hypothetical protein